MVEKTQKKLIQEVHQAMFGVPNTEDMGLVGDFKEVRQAVREQNHRYHKLNGKVNKIIGIVIGCGILSGGGYGIVQLLGG